MSLFAGVSTPPRKEILFFLEEEEVEKEEFGSLRSFSSLFDKYKTNNTVGSSLLLLLPRRRVRKTKSNFLLKRHHK